MLAPSGILGVIASVAVLAAPASARGPWAGSVDMNAACSEQYANGQGGWWAISLGTSAWDWRCTDQFGARESVDVTRYCSYTYGGNAVADPQGGGEYDWGCYFP